jgi:5-methylcytosine-specific restriction endonuclease McrA
MTSSSDYGRPYQRRRQALPKPEGDPCPFCHRPMWPHQRLQTDHLVPRALGGGDGPLRWAHGKCNEAAGARLGNRRRSARRWIDRWA